MSTYETSAHVMRPQQRRSREALARIVTAAELILKSRGLEDFSMASIAQEAGLPVGNIYRRFRGKDDLLLAVKESVTARIETAIGEHLAARRPDSAEMLIRHFADGLIGVFATDESVHRILFDYRVRRPAMDRLGSEARRRIFLSYRARLLPLLADVSDARREELAIVTFEIVASAVVAKAGGEDTTLDGMSWDTLGSRFGDEAIAFLATIRS